MLTATFAVLAAFQAPSSLPGTPKAPATESRPTAAVTLPATSALRDSVARAASRPAESRPAGVFHSRVQVTLKNQQKFTGIVKANRFVEVESGVGFRAGVKEEKGAGVRLWFANKGQNWLFLRYVDIQGVQTIGRVSDIEVREMEARLDAELDERLSRENMERIAEVSAQVKALNDARQKEEAEEAARKKEEAEKKRKESKDKATKLLERFPEEQGWGEERRKEILKRRNNHIYPTPEEAEFLNVYPEWVKAKQVLDKDKENGGKDDDSDGSDDDDGGGAM